MEKVGIFFVPLWLVVLDFIGEMCYSLRDGKNDWFFENLLSIKANRAITGGIFIDISRGKSGHQVDLSAYLNSG